MKTKEQWITEYIISETSASDLIERIQADAQAHLLERIKALEVELVHYREVIGSAFSREGDGLSDIHENLVSILKRRDSLKSQLDEAHSALKCALDALVQMPKDQAWAEKHLGPDWKLVWSKQRQDAIAQIHACGIDGEAKEHPAVARVKELQSQLERRNRELLDPPADVQELVIKKLNLVSAEALDRATTILRRNLASLRADVNLKGQVNQQRHDDYLEACRICGVEA